MRTCQRGHVLDAANTNSEGRCRTCVRAAGRARYAADPEKGREKARRYREANPEKNRAAVRAWKAANPQAHRDHNRAWFEANRERAYEWLRVGAARRRARIRSAPSAAFTARQLAARMAYFGGRCWMCGAEADQVDHVKPLAKGGSHMLSNLRPACGPCNKSKKDAWSGPVARQRVGMFLEIETFARVGEG